MQEAEWAKARYDDLLAKFTAKLEQTITEEGLDYIPASVVETNDENRMKDSRDANWASMFLFGRWHWDGYLYGAEQPEDNISLKLLDDTYSYGINRRIQEDTTDSPYNFGGIRMAFIQVRTTPDTEALRCAEKNTGIWALKRMNS